MDHTYAQSAIPVGTLTEYDGDGTIYNVLSTTAPDAVVNHIVPLASDATEYTFLPGIIDMFAVDTSVGDNDGSKPI